MCCVWTWRESGVGRASCLVEGKGGDGGWVGQLVEHVRGTYMYACGNGKRVSDNVVQIGNVLCRYDEIVHGSSKEKVAEEGHEVRAVWCAGHQALHHGLIVAQETDAKGGPLVAPGDGCQHNGVKFLPLDAVLQLLRGPTPVKPLSLTVGTIADGAGAVCEQLEVGGGGPLWQKEKGPAVPRCGKCLPPCQVQFEGLWE